MDSSGISDQAADAPLTTLRIGVDVFTTRQIARDERVSPRTVERWVTKDRDPLPALRVTAEQMYAMGYTGNLYHSQTGVYYLIRAGDRALIPAVRKYPANRRSPRSSRKGTVTGAGTPDRQK